MSNENERLCLYRSAGIFFCAIILSFALWVQAAPANSHKAEKAVKGWLKLNRKPLNAEMSSQVKSVDTFADEAGNAQ